MTGEIINDTISAIIVETIDSIPSNFISFYRNLPGRAPADSSKLLASILSDIDDQSAKALISAVVDSTVFRILYLIDAKFKDKNISVLFQRDAASASPDDYPLLDLYRSQVDPGGCRGNDLK